MPFKRGQSGNAAGRPRGRRNKCDPRAEYEKAFNAGMSYAEIIDMLSAKIRSAKDEDSKLSENELIKYIGKLLDVKKDVAKEYLQILKDAELKEQESKQQDTNKNNYTYAPVVQFKNRAD